MKKSKATRILVTSAVVILLVAGVVFLVPALSKEPSEPTGTSTSVTTAPATTVAPTTTPAPTGTTAVTTPPTVPPTTATPTQPTTVPTAPPTTAPATQPATVPATSTTVVPTTQPAASTSHVHVYIEIRKEPTCTEYGNINHICECGETESPWADGEYIDPLGHAYGDWVVTKESTTTSGGERQRTCSRCGYVNEDYMAPLDPVTGEKYVSYIDPRITIRTLNAVTYDYSESQCRLRDFRTWGEAPSVYVEDDGGLRVIYFLQDGTMRTELITPVEGYYSSGVIYDSGEFRLMRIGKVS